MAQSPEMIREYYERTRGQRENAVDFRTATRSVIQKYRDRLREVDDDLTLTDRERSRVKSAVAEEYRRTFNETLGAARRALDAEEERLARLANPPRRVSRDVGELLARRELREEVEGMNPEEVVDRYREAVAAGDVLAQETIEQHGPDRLRENALRQEFSDLSYEQQKARMPASQRAALDQLEGLVAEGERIRMAWATEKNLVAGEVRQAQESRPAITRDDRIGQINANRGGTA